MNEHYKMIMEIIKSNRVSGIIHHLTSSFFNSHNCEYINLYREIQAIEEEIKEMAEYDFKHIKKCSHECGKKDKGHCCICWDKYDFHWCTDCLERSSKE